MSFEDNIKQNINYFFKNIDNQKNNMFVNTLVKYFNNNIYIIGIGFEIIICVTSPWRVPSVGWDGVRWNAVGAPPKTNCLPNKLNN